MADNESTEIEINNDFINGLDKVEERYIACMVLHALGDTIGFKNGVWEFKTEFDSNYMIALEMLFEFIKLGGINGIDLKGWRVSDDTIFHISMAKALLEYSGKMDETDEVIIKNNLIDGYNEISDDSKKKIKRYMGMTLKKNIIKFTQTFDARNMSYDPDAGSNGCAMRNLVIGLAYFGAENRAKLIDFAMISSKMTHNSPHGYLAGLTSALFAAFAFEKMPIEKWGFELIDILTSKQVKSYVSDDINEYFAYISHIKYWKKYLDDRFKNGKILKTKSNENIIFRVRYFYDNFTKITDDRDVFTQVIGYTGYCAMMVAYDSLLDCDGFWEKLIIYSVFTSGDSDTIGAIAAGLYGIVHGFGDVPRHMFKNLEKKDELVKVARSIYKKFYLHEKV